MRVARYNGQDQAQGIRFAACKGSMREPEHWPLRACEGQKRSLLALKAVALLASCFITRSAIIEGENQVI